MREEENIIQPVGETPFHLGYYFAPPNPLQISTLFWLLPTTHKRNDMRQARQDQKQREIHIPSRTRACMHAGRQAAPFSISPLP